MPLPGHLTSVADVASIKLRRCPAIWWTRSDQEARRMPSDNAQGSPHALCRERRRGLGGLLAHMIETSHDVLRHGRVVRNMAWGCIRLESNPGKLNR